LGEAASGTGFTTGVWGFAQSPDGAGVYGENLATSGDAAGVLGYSESSNGTGGYFEAGAASGFTSGIWAVTNSAGGPAAYLQDASAAGGNLILGARLVNQVATNVFRVSSGGAVFAASYNTGGADFAESFDVGGSVAEYEPGDVLAIDIEGYRRVVKSSGPYSTLVAGIYSTKPGVLAHLPTAELEKQVPMAVIGVVPCKVTTENGPIKPGDLLVTSSRSGYAMKGTDAARMQGAIVGKALQALPSGDGLIEVLVTLQ
jgi:hypothetical protein